VQITDFLACLNEKKSCEQIHLDCENLGINLHHVVAFILVFIEDVSFDGVKTINPNKRVGPPS
jgi:hypothetical protein